MKKNSVLKINNTSTQVSEFINGTNWVTKENTSKEVKFLGIRIYFRNKYYTNDIKGNNKLGFNGKK